MPLTLDDLTDTLEPENTILFFGAGSSIPSGAPPVGRILEHLSEKFGTPASDYSLSEVAELVQMRHSRPALIKALRSLFARVKPSGGIANLPLYPWKSIFTTNYDCLIEKVYEQRSKILRVYHSDFDFQQGDERENCTLFKLHGTIQHDVADGHNSRIIISQSDYENTYKYREWLFDRLKGDLAGANLVIIGYSLSDPHISQIIDRASTLNSQALSSARIVLLMYSADEIRASLYEQRGMLVAFGGIDDFFAAISTKLEPAENELYGVSEEHFLPAALQPVTIDVTHSITQNTDITGMFNGRPAAFSNIASGLTFPRDVVSDIVNALNRDDTIVAVLLGSSGVGKTTAARQALIQLHNNGWSAWEHQDDHALSAETWLYYARYLKEQSMIGVLFIDDVHHHLQSFNRICEQLVAHNLFCLKVMACSSKGHWYPRIKSPPVFNSGRTFFLEKLSGREIERLLDLVETKEPIKRLVEKQFSGFDRRERRRRLEIKCEKDFFVCLKNIFASDAFDDIVLREYADLDDSLQDIYRYVAAMEDSGVRVHRQMIIRILGIEAIYIRAILAGLADVIGEYEIDRRKGVYGWRSRHSVIAKIITKYKFHNMEKIISLFDLVIDNISPTYDIEMMSIRELCNVETGISRIPDKETQNRLFRKIVSNAPGERVPRHRLIRNLIEQGYFDKADTEIRLFETDFGTDGPVQRYKIQRLLERAKRSPGLLEEDRVAILEEAYALARAGARRFSGNKAILATFADLGLEYFRKTGSREYFDEALEAMRRAEETVGDPHISRLIARYSQELGGVYVPPDDGTDSVLD